MKFSSILSTIALVLISASCFAQYQIGHKSFSFLDPDRSNRDVWGEVYYPADVAGDDVAMSAGQYPLIVFGHGFATRWDEYSIWWEELVADGYILAFPRTEGNVLSTDHTRFSQDLAFLIDAFNAESADAASFYHQTMTGRNAIMGHSMGGGCSYVAAGNYGANVETIITMAAAETSESAIGAAANITFPVLTLAGTEDCVVMTNEAPIDMYNGLTSAPYKAFVDIIGASHCQFGLASGGSNCRTGETFTFGCGPFMPIADQHTQMFLSAHPWLDFYLKDDCARWNDFKTNLTTNASHNYQEAGAIPVPTVNVTSANTSICSGSSTMLTATVVDGVACSAQWSLNGSVISGATALTYSATLAGTYSYEVTNADGMMSSGSASLTVNPSPMPNISGTTAICAGSSTMLDAGAGFASYLWSDGSTMQTLSVSTAGTYDITVTDANGCSGTSSSTVTVNTPAALSISGTLNICAGTSTNLTASSGFSSYLWSDGSTSSSLTVNASGTYSVTATDTNGCTNTDMVSVNVAAPVVASISGADNFCNGGSTMLDAGVGYASYLWSDGSTNQTLSVNSSGTYDVTVTEANGCTGTASESITVFPLPTVAISGSTSVCSGSSTILDAGVGYASYLWSNGSTTQTLTTSAAGTYTVTITDVNGCTATDNVTVSTATALSPSISGNTVFCNGTSTMLDVGAGYASYLWSDGSTTQTLMANASGSYSVTVTDANGCTGMASISVTEDVAVAPVITGTFEFCTGENTTLDAGLGYADYLWSDGSTSQTLTVNTGGTYTVTVTNGNGCSGMDMAPVIVNPNPTASVSQVGDILSSNAAGGSTFTYQWYHNMNPIAGATSATYDAAGSGSGDYYVEITNEFGCTSISSTASIIPTSNTEIESLDNFEIRPTLADQDIQIILGTTEGFEGQIMIHDMSGRQLHSEQVQFFGTHIIPMDVSDFPKGFYLLSIRNDQGIMTRKFVKM